MINNCTFMGRLCMDPEPRQTRNGKSVTSFDIAVQRTYDKEHADFIPIVCWGGTADFVTSYFHKGDMIGVKGSIQTRNYEDKQGNKRTAVEILAETVSFCGGKKQATTPPEEPPAPEPDVDKDYSTLDTDDDLPF